ncbi:MAG: hypothetical protein A2017_16830 [Lentisphaerae bacterium GWF2_44_16]|nr:MAG: hypothetical protein A2017_16830 [Lentisphaerae bacterium GWF2_44_16]
MPEMKQSKMFHFLRDGKIEDFNRELQRGTAVDLENADLRGVDLRGCNLKGVSLKGAYMSYTDLRGLDLRFSNLEGASIKSAKISGAYFPENIMPEEILMSVTQGTRMRTVKHHVYEEKGKEQ